MIWAPVGDTMELVDSDLFTDIHEYLALSFARHGLAGDELDNAIARAIPLALEWALYGNCGTFH
jgi:hypothetical protein